MGDPVEVCVGGGSFRFYQGAPLEPGPSIQTEKSINCLAFQKIITLNGVLCKYVIMSLCFEIFRGIIVNQALW